MIKLGLVRQWRRKRSRICCRVRMTPFILFLERSKAISPLRGTRARDEKVESWML